MLQNGSFQFVLVFIEKFIGLVKPYVNYEYYSDGNDRGFPGKSQISMENLTWIVRECAARIIELSKDRQKLRETRKESSKLRERIIGTSDDKVRRSHARSSGAKKKFVLDEDAFYS